MFDLELAKQFLEYKNEFKFYGSWELLFERYEEIWDFVDFKFPGIDGRAYIEKFDGLFWGLLMLSSCNRVSNRSYYE